MSLLNNVEKYQEVLDLTDDLVKFITEKKIEKVPPKIGKHPPNRETIPRNLGTAIFGIASDILKVVPIVLYDHQDFQKYSKGFITNSAIYINANYMQQLYEEEIKIQGTTAYTTAIIAQAAYEFLTHNKINLATQNLIKKQTNVQEFNQFFDIFISDKDLFTHFKHKEEEFSLALSKIYNNVDIKDLKNYQINNDDTISELVLEYLKNPNTEISSTEILNNYKNITNKPNDLNIEEQAKKDWHNNICNLDENYNAQSNIRNIKYLKTISNCAITDAKNHFTKEQIATIWNKFGEYIIHSYHISNNLSAIALNNLYDTIHKDHMDLIISNGFENKYIQDMCHSIVSPDCPTLLRDQVLYSMSGFNKIDHNIPSSKLRKFS